MTPVREGDVLAGKYRIERVLGVGGMGVVVAARHEQLGQLVAIKFIREDALGNEDAVERFLREARSAVRLKSDHVARVIDVGKLESGAPYMVMEFLDGDDLARVLEEHGPMAPDAAVELVLQACDAVAEAHAAGIVHRDLKPENLFLTKTLAGRPKLKVLDFGVSKSSGMMGGGQGALTRTRSMLGSPLYMAPEQMRSAKDVDARADVWALGVVLFQLLTCRWPFEAQNMPELCLKVVTEPPQPIASLRPDLAPGLIAVIERCLDKDAARRYVDASALAQALEPFAPEFAPRRSPSAASLERPEVSVAPATRATLPSSDVPSQVTPAPSAWDSAGRRAPSSSATPRGRSLVWIGGLVAVLVVAFAFSFSRRSATGPMAPAVGSAVQVSFAPPRAAAELPTPPAMPVPVPTLAPLTTLTTTEAPAASLATLETVADAAPPKSAAQLPRPARAAPRQPSQTQRPSAAKTDDDIPALR
jgi:serine/threonine-protein kinase